MKPKSCIVANDTEIVYRVINDNVEGVTMIFSGGLGGTHLVWSALAKELRKKHKIIIWDYPGLPNGTLGEKESELDIPFLAKCHNTILKNENEKKACAVGWSLGPQIAFEAYRQTPESLCSILLGTQSF